MCIYLYMNQELTSTLSNHHDTVPLLYIVSSGILSALDPLQFYPPNIHADIPSEIYEEYFKVFSYFM